MSLQRFTETLMTAQTSGVAVTAAAATTLLPPHALFPLPGQFFDTIGKKIQVKASGRLSTVITTPGNLRFDIRFGGTIVFDSLAIALTTGAAYTNVGWWIDIELTCQIVGAAAQLFGQGIFSSPNVLGGANVAMPIGGVVAQLPWNTAPALGTAFDARVSQQVDFFFTQTVATGSCQLHQYELISKN